MSPLAWGAGGMLAAPVVVAGFALYERVTGYGKGDRKTYEPSGLAEAGVGLLATLLTLQLVVAIAVLDLALSAWELTVGRWWPRRLKGLLAEQPR